MLRYHNKPCNPDCAWSDRKQQITPERLKQIIDSLVFRNNPIPEESLNHLRQEIDQLDIQLIEILAKRMEISRQIGDYKHTHKMPIVQPNRYNDVIDTRLHYAEQTGLGKEFMRKILSDIHEESVRIQCLPNSEGNKL